MAKNYPKVKISVFFKGGILLPCAQLTCECFTQPDNDCLSLKKYSVSELMSYKNVLGHSAEQPWKTNTDFILYNTTMLSLILTESSTVIL